MSLHYETFVFESPVCETDEARGRGYQKTGTSRLKMCAKRYTVGASTSEKQGLTLLFAHCIGAHKEQWEPTIERLFELQRRNSEPSCRIREAWCFDWQNHGDSAVLNEEKLKNRPDGVSIYEWARGIAAFVRSPWMKGHRIVTVGHSAGAGATMVTTKEFPPHQPPYVSMIFVEPTMVTKELYYDHIEERQAQMDFSVNATSVRRDTWASREDAYAYFSKRLPWNIWDPRVLHLLTTYGLQEAPNSTGVTLKCDRKQEAISYPDVDGHFEGAVILGPVSQLIPVHLIWGAKTDFVSETVQNSLCDKSKGYEVASVRKVEMAGHMVVQEQPDRLAQIISEILGSLAVSHRVFAKL